MCHCYVCSTPRNNFLLYDREIQQSILTNYDASITELEGNTIVVNMKNKIKNEENGREGCKEWAFSSKSIPVTPTRSWHPLLQDIKILILFMFIGHLDRFL